MAYRLSLGGLPLMGRNVAMGDVYVGAGLSVLGYALVNYLNTLTYTKLADGSVDPSTGLLDKLPTWLKPVVGPAIAGAGMFAFSKYRKKPGRAEGHLAGAVAVGAAMVIRQGLTEVVAGQVKTAAPDSILRKISFAGVPIRLVTSQFDDQGIGQFSEVVAGGRFQGMGEVLALPGARLPFGEVVRAPNFLNGRYADQAALNGMARASEATMHNEMSQSP